MQRVFPEDLILDPELQGIKCGSSNLQLHTLTTTPPMPEANCMKTC